MRDASGNLPAKEPTFPLLKEEIDGFAARSAVLGGILCGGEATNILAAYERVDQRAIKERGRFSSVATRLNRTVLVTAGIGALILALGVLQPGVLQPWLQQHVDPPFDQTVSWIVATLGFFGLLVGGYAAALLYELNAGDLARDWTQNSSPRGTAAERVFRSPGGSRRDSQLRDSRRCPRPRHQTPASRSAHLLRYSRQTPRGGRRTLAAIGGLCGRRRLGRGRRGRHGRRRGWTLVARRRRAWGDRYGSRVIRHIAGGNRSGTGAGAAVPEQRRRARTGGQTDR